MLKWSLIPLLLISTHVFAQDDDLGEATGLEPASSPNALPTASPSRGKWRGYGVVEWRANWQDGELDYKERGPNLEAGGSFDYGVSDSLNVFGDAKANYVRFQNDQDVHLNQGGLRFKPTESTVIAIGKERNRRAPGLLLSPSDFIHSSPNLPGQREERDGRWLGRFSVQSEQRSLDLVTMPFAYVRSNGLPDDSQKYLGTMLRYFERRGGFDIGIETGSIDNGMVGGLFAQTLVAQVWKLYGEAGYNDENRTASYLAGVSYEGNADWSAKFELYHRDEDWIPIIPLFSDQSYAISNIGALDLFHRFNISETFVRSLTSEQLLNFVRIDWLATGSQVVGVSAVNLRDDGDKFLQGIVDWTLNF